MAQLIHNMIEHADKIGYAISAIVAAVSAATVALVPILNRLKKLSSKVDTLSNISTPSLLAAARVNVLDAVKGSCPDRVHTLDIKFAQGIYVSIPVIVGKTYSPWPGLDLTGIRSCGDGTFYNLTTTHPVTLVRHSHEEKETVEVIMGSMTDLDSGRVYRKGETWEIEPQRDHRVFFEAHGIFVVTVQPPLPKLAERPVSVDRLTELADLT